MDPSDEPAMLSAAFDALPNWFVFGVPLIGLGLMLVLAIGVVWLWTLIQHARRIEVYAARLQALESVAAALKGLGSGGKELDLRRIEHVLIEIRDGQKRLDDELLATLQSERARGLEAFPAQGVSVGLGDRVVNRLVALGYERVQLLTPASEVAAFAQGDGEIVVEARRYGALCKGRVHVRDGLLADVQLQPTYGAFP